MFKKISKSFKSAITKAAFKLHIKQAKKAPIPPPLPPRPKARIPKIYKAVIIVHPDENVSHYYIELLNVIDCAVDTTLCVDQPSEEQMDIEMQSVIVDLPMEKKPLKSILKRTGQVFPSILDSQETISGDIPDNTASTRRLANYSDFDSQETLCDGEEFEAVECPEEISVDQKHFMHSDSQDTLCEDTQDDTLSVDEKSSPSPAPIRLVKSCSMEALLPKDNSSRPRSMSVGFLM